MKYIVATTIGSLLWALTVFLIQKKGILQKRRGIAWLTVLAVEVISSLALTYKVGFGAYSILLLVYIAVICYISVEDLAERQIGQVELCILGIVGLAVCFFIPGTRFWLPILTSVIVGMVLYLVSKKSGEAIGKGDVFCIAFTALCFGLNGFFSAVVYALVIGLVYGLAGLIFKKKGMKQAIPFAPCLVIGIVLTLFKL